MRNNKQVAIKTVNQSLIDRFELIVNLFKNKEAIRDESGSITFQLLHEKSNVIANEILTLEPDRKQIALFLPNDINQFVAIFGILKAGCAYVPLDTGWPARRIAYAISDSAAFAVITDNENYPQVKALCDKACIINIEEVSFAENVHPPRVKPKPDDIAHILYTSGSSGDPKGVFTNHRNQIHFVKRFSEFLGLSPDDRFAYYFSIGFSAHAMPFLGALLNGGVLVMYDLQKNGFPRLAEFFNVQRITRCLMIPSVLRHFRVTLDKNYKFTKLKTLLIGGETLYANDIKRIWPFLMPTAEIINIYASTELYLAAAYRMRRATVLKQNIIPIGYTVDGFEIDIINEDGEKCTVNEPGEMHIHSQYAALGYWNQPELTNLHFSVADTIRSFNSHDLAYKRTEGAFVHIGRSDAMVKIRGHRIDLGEIENALLFNEDIQEVAVTLRIDPNGNKVLVAYHVNRPGKHLELDEFKTELIRRLPDFMMPSHHISLPALPKTASGKTDYRSLPDPDWVSPEKARDIKHPENSIEKLLISIFEKQLEIYPIGTKDNVLKAGHDSLKLFVAFDSIEKQFNIKLKLDSFIENPTIEEISKIVKQLQKEKHG